MVNSRSKGKNGELEWAEYCRDVYDLGHARRSQQYCGTADSQDVVTWPGTHAEVKRAEHLNVELAMQQAEEDCGTDPKMVLCTNNDVPYVAHRKNRTDWLVTVRASNLLEFCRRVLAASPAAPGS